MITARRQQQATCDVLHGVSPDCDLDQLTSPYDYLVGLIESAPDSDRAYALLTMAARGDDEELKRAVDAVLVCEPGYRASYETLAQAKLTEPEVSFLWEEWLPRGFMSVLAAWPGVGKTYVGLNLAHLLTSGQAAPDGVVFNARARRVIYVDAEDFLPELCKRAKAWEMDGQQFYIVRRPPRALIDLLDRSQQEQLIDMCYDLRPDLVIVDSLSMVNQRGENNVEDLRDILGFFCELPQMFDCSLLLIHHPRKPGPGVVQPITMHDLRGTGHLVAMGRTIIGLDVVRSGPDDNPNGPRRLHMLKSNWQYPKPLTVNFTPSQRDPKVAELSYAQGVFFEDPRHQVDECARWLADLLREEPLSYKEILEVATGRGFKENVLLDARKLLVVEDTVGRQKKGNKWRLVGE